MKLFSYFEPILHFAIMKTLTLSANSPALPLVPDVLAVQHNALVNARFGLGTLEMRLFLCMLGRIGRNDGLG